ncbi:MAG: helix-turn-helix transcriptional regulator [Desulfomonile sp.]
MTRLQLLRKTRGFSQAELAVRMGIAPSELSRIENDWYKRIPVRIEGKLKKIFGKEWTLERFMEQVEAPDQNAA